MYGGCRTSTHLPSQIFTYVLMVAFGSSSASRPLRQLQRFQVLVGAVGVSVKPTDKKIQKERIDKYIILLFFLLSIVVGIGLLSALLDGGLLWLEGPPPPKITATPPTQRNHS